MPKDGFDRRYFVTDPETGKKVRVPGVTTIAGRFGDIGGLKYWAWQVGYDGYTLDEAPEKATDIGTATHAMVEARVKGFDPPDISKLDAEVQTKVQRAYANYLEWETAYGFVGTDSEFKVVSTKHRVGGRIDAIGWTGGDRVNRTLFDLKTSNALWPKDLLQIAAYLHIYLEACPNDAIDRVVVLRCSKESGLFSPLTLDPEALDPAWEAFLNERRNYEIEKQLKKLL